MDNQEMPPALSVFMHRIAELDGPIDAWAYNDEECPTLTLPAKHVGVGALVIYDEGEELTVAIGEIHHTHFSARDYDGDSDESRRIAAALAAADFAHDVTEDRVCFTVDYLGDRCTGASSFWLADKNTTPDTVRDTALGLAGGNIRTERYLWSGPIPAKP